MRPRRAAEDLGADDRLLGRLRQLSLVDLEALTFGVGAERRAELVSAYAEAGRVDEARALMERLLDVRNDLGLLPEEYDPVGRRFAGNFPQAFSHLALVSAAIKLERAAG